MDLFNPKKPSVKLKGVIFDKDGTLVDLNATWGASMSRTLNQITTDPQTRRVLAATLGLDTETESFKSDSVVPHSHPLKTMYRVSKFVDPAEFSRLNIANASETLCEIDGATTLLQDLSGCEVEVFMATNDAADTANLMVSQLRWQEYFTAIFGYDSGRGPKPEPGMLEACATICSASNPDEVVMVGDTVTDLKAAKAAQCTYIQRGPLDHGDHEPPDFTINSLTELVPLLSGGS